jgi:ATP-dependent Lon protease
MIVNKKKRSRKGETDNLLSNNRIPPKNTKKRKVVNKNQSVENVIKTRPRKKIDYRELDDPTINKDEFMDEDSETDGNYTMKDFIQDEQKIKKEDSEYKEIESLAKNNNEKTKQMYLLMEKIKNNESEELDKHELVSYAPIYSQIIEKIKNNTPTVMKILKSNISFDDKCTAMELFDVYELSSRSVDKMELKTRINKMIISNNEIISPEKQRVIDTLKNIARVKKSLNERIIESNIDMDTKAVIYEKFLTWESMVSTDSEKAKLKDWIEYALMIPQTVKPLLNDQIISDNIKNKKIINKYLCNVQRILDNKIYGMDSVKKEILLIVNNILSNPSAKNKHLAIIGPPGVGKTEIIRSMAEALDLPFEQISMGGVNDVSFLDGHGYTYEGACPGIIVKTLKKMGYKNGIIFFDEIDKIAKTSKGNEVAWNLLHILDPTQNNSFRDKYLDEVKIDLSNLWFVYSLNDESMLDKILRDRLDIIKVNDYSNEEKREIAKKFLIPRALKETNINPSDLMFSDNIIDYIIKKLKDDEKKNVPDNYSTGVRQLNRCIQKLIRSFSVAKNASIDNKGGMGELRFNIPFKISFPFVVTKLAIDSLL